jgi:formate dehydrogenase
MERKTWDENILQELAHAMTDASICGLGQAASNPLKMVLKHFRDDIVFD